MKYQSPGARLSCATALLFGVLSCILVAGCGNNTDMAAKDDADMRKTMTRKNWSINDVPPDKRAMVEAMMKQSQAGQAPTAPGRTGATGDSKTSK